MIIITPSTDANVQIGDKTLRFFVYGSKHYISGKSLFMSLGFSANRWKSLARNMRNAKASKAFPSLINKHHLVEVWDRGSFAICIPANQLKPFIRSLLELNAIPSRFIAANGLIAAIPDDLNTRINNVFNPLDRNIIIHDTEEMNDLYAAVVCDLCQTPTTVRNSYFVSGVLHGKRQRNICVCENCNWKYELDLSNWDMDFMIEREKMKEMREMEDDLDEDFV